MADSVRFFHLGEPLLLCFHQPFELRDDYVLSITDYCLFYLVVLLLDQFSHFFQEYRQLIAFVVNLMLSLALAVNATGGTLNPAFSRIGLIILFLMVLDLYL